MLSLLAYSSQTYLSIKYIDHIKFQSNEIQYSGCPKTGSASLVVSKDTVSAEPHDNKRQAPWLVAPLPHFSTSYDIVTPKLPSQPLVIF